eukprot:jgi/Ulvmu1/6718/UM030_0051.1
MPRSPRKKQSGSKKVDDSQNGDHLPVVRAARNPGTQSILAFDTDLGDGEVERLLNNGENGEGPMTNGADADKCGVYKTLANIFISFLGAGILTLPYAFKESGLLLGGGFLTVLALLAYYCILLLVDCKKVVEHKGAVTYSEVAEHALGPVGKTVVEVQLVLSQAGFCIAYLIFIYKTLTPFLPLSATTIVVILLPFQVALAMLRDTAALASFSLLADCAHVIGIVVVLKDDVENYSQAHESVVASRGPAALPFLFGVVIYCYEGISMILPIQDAMKDKAKFRGTLTFGFTMISFIFLIFGAVGYCAFGDGTADMITDNLPDGWTTYTVKLALCLALFFTFPMMMVPVYEVLEQGLARTAWFETSVAPARRWMVVRVLRTLVVLLLGLIARCVPGFELFVSFIGSLCCAPLAFIIPATCHLVLHQGKLSWAAKAMDYCMLLFGFTGMVFGVAHAISAFYEALEAEVSGD